MAEPLAEVKLWLEKGAQLRARLVEERQRLTQRFVEIDAVLSSLGYAHPEPPVARQVRRWSRPRVGCCASRRSGRLCRASNASRSGPPSMRCRSAARSSPEAAIERAPTPPPPGRWSAEHGIQIPTADDIRAIVREELRAALARWRPQAPTCCRPSRLPPSPTSPRRRSAPGSRREGCAPRDAGGCWPFAGPTCRSSSPARTSAPSTSSNSGLVNDRATHAEQRLLSHARAFARGIAPVDFRVRWTGRDCRQHGQPRTSRATR